MKVGGSTVAGVNTRIASRLGQRLLPGNNSWCNARWDHSSAYHMKYGRRIRSESFLWTVLREPTRRAVSQFFHFKV